MLGWVTLLHICAWMLQKAQLKCFMLYQLFSTPWTSCCRGRRGTPAPWSHGYERCSRTLCHSTDPQCSRTPLEGRRRDSCSVGCSLALHFWYSVFQVLVTSGGKSENCAIQSKPNCRIFWILCSDWFAWLMLCNRKLGELGKRCKVYIKTHVFGMSLHYVQSMVCL